MERFNETYRLWQPMKYATAKKKEVLDAALVSDEYGIELKVDGSSYVWSKDLDGSVHLYGDKISKKTGEVIDKIDNMPHMKAFAEEFFKTEEARPLTGQNFLIGEVIRKYVLQILRRDAKLTPFTYLESERRVNGLIRLSDGTDIRLKGFIDRVDEVRGATRIIDYKSGLGTNIFNDVEALFDKEEADRAKAVMQVFLYCWMYARLPENAGKALAPGIYYVRTLFADPFDPAVYRRLERGKSAKAKVDDFSVYAESFEEALRHSLDEMFDPSIPFTQTTNGKACAYCMFQSICGK